jgi:hypothetical protein
MTNANPIFVKKISHESVRKYFGDDWKHTIGKN